MFYPSCQEYQQASPCPSSSSWTSCRQTRRGGGTQEGIIRQGFRGGVVQYEAESSLEGSQQGLLDKQHRTTQEVTQGGGDRGDEVLPLTKHTVEMAAAALKAAGLKLASADQYLNELKLMHVESGYDAGQDISAV